MNPEPTVIMKTLSPIFAILTPFDSSGRIDKGALHAYLEFLRLRGADTILVGGTTGEFCSLTLLERMDLLDECRENFSGTVIQHVSACSIENINTLVEHANDLANALLILPAYYYANINETGMFDFFARALVNACKPTYLYNFPLHTQFDLSVHFVLRIRQANPHIVGIKNSRGKTELAKPFKQELPDLKVYLGSDSNILSARQEGLDGSVTGGGNPVPEYLVQITRHYEENKIQRALAIQTELDRWNSFRKALPDDQIAIAKAALACRIPGFPVRVRPPLTVVCTEIEKKVRNYLLKMTAQSPYLTA